ncbi:MAG: glycosyltransferase family 39 protein [Blastocatellia bacterium]
MKHIRLSFVLIFLLAAGVRASMLWEPINTFSWREADLASIARNYYQEGMNLFYPRIDWRGEGPGYTEIEFPLYSWSAAVLFQIFGYHEFILRLMVYALSLVGMWMFFKLARYLLPDAGAIAATLFYALSPLAVFISTAIQAEGLMFCCYVTAFYGFVRWIDERSRFHYWLAVGAASLAILTKAPAAHLGVAFALIVLTRVGWKALRDPAVWIFAVVALLPALLWYRYAHQLWLGYGNSMGLSNEYHWIGRDFFTNPSFIKNIVRMEVFRVWMPTGIVIAALGVWFRWSDRAVRYALFWLVAVAMFYIIGARSTGDDWAFYYHLFSVAPVALLVGAGAEVISNLSITDRMLKAAIALSLSLLVISGLAWLASVSFVHLGGQEKWLPRVAVLFALVAAACAGWRVLRRDELQSRETTGSGWMKAALGYGLVVLLCATLLFQVRGIAKDVLERPTGLYACVPAFSAALKEPGLILASGGACHDPDGYQVAYNASYFFYWLKRKGFNVCEAEQSLPVIRSFAERGARYFVAEKQAMRKQPGFEAEMRRTYPVVSECAEAVLFQLTANHEQSAARK